MGKKGLSIFLALFCFWAGLVFGEIKPVVQVGDKAWVFSVAFSPDGRYLAGGSSTTIKLWEVSTGRPIRTLKGHKDLVRCVVFSPDGRYLASGSGNEWLEVDTTIKLWEVSTGRLIRTLKGHKDLVRCVVFSPDGKYLASGSGDEWFGNDTTIKLWEVSTGRLIRTLKGHKKGCISVAFSPDGRYLASGSSDTTIKLWEVSTGRLIRTLKGHKESVLSIAFSPDGRYLASGGGDRTIKLWEVKTGRLLKTLKCHKCWVDFVSFSPDGRYLASGSGDTTIKLWEVSTGRLIRTLKGHKESVLSIAFSPDGRLLVSGSGDGTIKIWNVPFGNLVATFYAFPDASVVITPEGYFSGTGNYKKYVHFVDYPSLKTYSYEKFALQFDKPEMVAMVLKGKKVPSVAKVNKSISVPPYLEIKKVQLIDENQNRLFEAGEKIYLTVIIANTGKGQSPWDTKLKVSSSIFGEKTITLGTILPQKEVKKKFKFVVPVNIKTQKEKISIELLAGKYSPEPVKIYFYTKAPVPPKFKITYRIDDDQVGESIGNGNGIVEPRETIELWINIANTGKGKAKGVEIFFKSKDLDVLKGRAKVGNLPPGGKTTAKFLVFVPADFKEKQAHFNLEIKEALGIFYAGINLTLNIKKRGSRVYEYLADHVPEVTEEGEEVKVEVKVESSLKKSERACVSQYPNRYLFASMVFDYEELDDLKYVKNDIILVKRLARCYLGVPEDNIRVIANPSVGRFKKELRDFVNKIKERDAIFYFYYSGHGVMDSKGKFYLLPRDASVEDEQILTETAVSIDKLKILLNRAKGYKVAFIDACRVSPRWKPAVVINKPQIVSTAFIFSTTQGKISNADKEGKHSAFTRAFYEMARSGLKNIDLDASGYIEIKELLRPLKNWLKEVSYSEQNPDIWGVQTIPIFPLK